MRDPDSEINNIQYKRGRINYSILRYEVSLTFCESYEGPSVKQQNWELPPRTIWSLMNYYPRWRI